MKKFSLVISTKNRICNLKITLFNLEKYILNSSIEVFLLNDGSDDETEEYVRSTYPLINYLKNEKSQGIHAVRNKLLNIVKTDYIISIDDDAHFLSQNNLEIIELYFDNNKKVGLLSFRSFWDLQAPSSIETNEKAHRVQSFGAVGFAIRKSAWEAIPNLLEWFVFYGEENYMSFQLYLKSWEIHYLPKVLVHHRVNIKSRKKNKDYRIRLRRSLRSGWYVYILFYPFEKIPRIFLYTLWIQVKKKTFKGDIKATIAIIQALSDVLINIPRLIKSANRLSRQEFNEYQKLPETVLYWSPKEKK